MPRATTRSSENCYCESGFSSYQVDSSIGILDFLEQTRKERDELVALVASLEKRLGITSDSRTGDRSTQEPVNGKPKVTVSIDSIPVGFFHNLSQPQAAEKLLRMNTAQPLTTQQIVDCFRKSGMELNPKNATTILYTALTRSPKFERVGRKAWGLAEWYPEKKKRTGEPSKEQSETEPGADREEKGDAS